MNRGAPLGSDGHRARNYTFDAQEGYTCGFRTDSYRTINRRSIRFALRAGLALVSGLSQADFRDSVRVERKRELLFEGTVGSTSPDGACSTRRSG